MGKSDVRTNANNTDTWTNKTLVDAILNKLTDRQPLMTKPQSANMTEAHKRQTHKTHKHSQRKEIKVQTKQSSNQLSLQLIR